MDVVALSETNVNECATRAAEILRAGGVVLYPTDTLYGLGADALSDAAIAKVYEIKGRDKKKPMHAVFADVGMAAEYAQVNDTAKKLAAKFLPGALTLVVKKKAAFTTGIGKGMDTIGVRIPANDLCLNLARTFGKPFTATSANIAGEQPHYSVDKILEQLGPRAESIDLVIDAGVLPMQQPTTVVSIADDGVAILREDSIPKEEILAAV